MTRTVRLVMPTSVVVAEYDVTDMTPDELREFAEYLDRVSDPDLHIEVPDVEEDDDV